MTLVSLKISNYQKLVLLFILDSMRSMHIVRLLFTSQVAYILVEKIYLCGIITQLFYRDVHKTASRDKIISLKHGKQWTSTAIVEQAIHPFNAPVGMGVVVWGIV